jgi:membrane associated rhomboid family serine protease
MLPLRDDNPCRRFPAVTTLLIVVNVLAFLWELGLGRRLEEALLMLGLVPVRYTVGEVAGLFTWHEQLAPFVTSIFLHGGWSSSSADRPPANRSTSFLATRTR